MLIDWVTAYLPMSYIDENHWEQLRLLTDRVMRYCPRTGEQVWETSAWESIRSDSHQIAFRVGSDSIWIQGSPARIIGSGDAVFGEGVSNTLDLPGCLDRMRQYISGQINVPLTANFKHWTITRIDITGNLLLDTLADVRIALRTLRECEGGRYRVSQQAGDTVYWSHKSRLKSGKAYAKGPHINYQMSKPGYTGRIYTAKEKSLIDRLLRLELKLGSQYLRERIDKPWYEITPNDLKNEWSNYFEKMIGSAEMKTDDDVKEQCLKAAKTPSQGNAAYLCFLAIQQKGWQFAKEHYTKPTWYRHLKVLHAAGLGDCDISAGKVVQLRRKVIECQMIHSFDDLLIAA